MDCIWSRKTFLYIAAHEIAKQLGENKAKSLPLFHALTGCDAVSFFAGKGKKSAWDTWLVYPAVTDVLVDLASVPAHIPEESINEIERFVVLLYDRTSNLSTVHAARQHLFSRGSRSLENIPPTRAALIQHIKRAVYQAGHVWATCLQRKPHIPDPANWGWKQDASKWEPLWTDLPQLQSTCYELIKCNCKKACRGLCKCTKANLQCTGLCACVGNCYQD